MAKLGRNERCSCGSGLKVKRCCGTQAAAERFERAAGAVGEAFTLATHFPRLRARGREFSHWADSAAESEPTWQLLEEGLALLDETEVSRIVGDHRRESPDAWRTLCEEIGSEEDAVGRLLVGAVFASVMERKPLDEAMLGLIAENEPEDDCDTLACAVEPGDLWSVVESYHAYEAITELDEGLGDVAYATLWTTTLAAQAERLATDWHRKRLAELVLRVRDQLPVAGHDAASAKLAHACETFEAGERLRNELAAALLEDSLDRIRIAELTTAVAAAA